MIHERSDSSNCRCESLAWHESALNRTFCPQGMWDGGSGWGRKKGGGRVREGSYRSCSFDFSTCSLISDLDINHPSAPGCMTVHEQIIRMRKVWTICNILSTGNQYCWWLPTLISNPMNSLLAMGETCMMCQVCVICQTLQRKFHRLISWCSYQREVTRQI